MQFEVKGAQEVASALLALREEFSAAAAKRALVPALRKSIKPAFERIKPQVPALTGKLRIETISGAKVSSMKVRKRKYFSPDSIAHGFVAVGVDYKDEKGQYRPAIEALEYGSKRQAAQPFLRSSFQAAIPAMTDALMQELSKHLESWANKQRAKQRMSV
jgi:HK97 gp10 family phage protein